jgi:hypothetical protein
MPSGPGFAMSAVGLEVSPFTVSLVVATTSVVAAAGWARKVAVSKIRPQAQSTMIRRVSLFEIAICSPNA